MDTIGQALQIFVASRYLRQKVDERKNTESFQEEQATIRLSQHMLNLSRRAIGKLLMIIGNGVYSIGKRWSNRAEQELA